MLILGGFAILVPNCLAAVVGVVVSLPSRWVQQCLIMRGM
jgi:hypothetical protein